MRKEQILLLVCVGIGGLLVYSATGKYTDVLATPLPEGSKVEAVINRPIEADKGLKGGELKGRALFAQVRLEKRAPMPELPAPAALPIFWVRPALGIWPGFWPRNLRAPIVPIAPAKPEKTDEQSGVVEDPAPTAQDPTAQDPTDIGDIKHAGQKPFNPAKQAKLVRLSGEEILVKLEPTDGPNGKFKGQPDWVILEKWPNVQFKVTQLNPKNGTEIGTNELVGPDMLQGYKTVHLAKSLDNEFWEERIGRGVKDTDRESLVKFAQWVFETLPKHSGLDEVNYGLGAVKKAIAELEKARKLQSDLPLTRLLGEYYHAGYDFEGELSAYLEYLAGHANDSGAQLLVGDAYERLGTVSAAAALYEKAAQTGDPEARLRVGLVLERQGRLDEAMETLRNAASAGNVAPRAYTAMARIALARGATAEAAGYAEQARKDGGPAAQLVYGMVLNAQGKFADAEKAFAAARQDDVNTAWRSSRGIALAGKGDYDEAQKELQACLDTDPLNLLDPLFGLGDVFQRKADTALRSNNAFETALARSPDNPWALLRVGTIRLRDGQPQKALDMALRLLEVAPGCNEGLWLAGRAAASLEKPDWDRAIAYLRRAVEKEPDNRDFIHEYARALLLAGRTDEAIKVLEAATNVTNGIARSDARLLGLLAWARFVGKRPINDVFEAIERGKRNQPDDATKEWLNTVRKIMDDWDKTRIWQDDFDRQASSTVGNGWNEADQANGINIGLDGKTAVFSCQSVKQAAPSREGATRLERDEDLGKLKSMEASFKASPGVETIFHMKMGPLPNRGDQGGGGGGRGGRAAGGFEIGLGCDRTGTMVLWVTGNGTKGGGTQEWIVKNADGTPRAWPMDEYHTVKIVRKDDQKGIYEVWLDDERIAGGEGKTQFEVGSLSMQSGKVYQLGFLLDADAGAQVSVSAEYVQVTKTNR